MIELLSLLLDGYALVGNFPHQGRGGKWAAKQELHEYLIFTKIRVCPTSGEWPELTRCLNSEYSCRVAWLEQLRKGKSLSEAIRDTVTERHGNWSWAVSSVASQYATLSNARGSTPDAPPEGEFPEIGADGAPPPGGILSNPRRRGRAKSRSRARVSWQDPQVVQERAPRSRSAPGHIRENPVSRSGVPFCKAFNSGQCSEGRQCPKGHVHACSFIDSSGRLCGKPGHRRCHHGTQHR